jgi:hypothetical protein
MKRGLRVLEAVPVVVTLDMKGAVVEMAETAVAG